MSFKLNVFQEVANTFKDTFKKATHFRCSSKSYKTDRSYQIYGKKRFISILFTL